MQIPGALEIDWRAEKLPSLEVRERKTYGKDHSCRPIHIKNTSISRAI